MKDPSLNKKSTSVFRAAFTYSIPVLLGYITIGIAFGLLVSDAGYSWLLAFFMSLWMFAGAGQFIALGLFAAGISLWEACLIQLVVNARHIAYGLSMINRFPRNLTMPYFIFSMTDETFALLSSLPTGEKEGLPTLGKERDRFMLYIALLNQSYWVGGSVIGVLIGNFIPFNMEGIAFALTALFIVLFLEQVFRVFKIPQVSKSGDKTKFRSDFSLDKISIFFVSAVAALLTVFLLPERISLLAAMVLALLLSSFLEIIFRKGERGVKP